MYLTPVNLSYLLYIRRRLTKLGGNPYDFTQLVLFPSNELPMSASDELPPN